MTVDARLEQCLAAPNALQRLRDLIEKLYTQGQTQPMILELFEAARRQLRQAGRERDEDTLTEAMDFLIGWCSPHMDLAGPPQPKPPGKGT
jgi:hypothetical protein